MSGKRSSSRQQLQQFLQALVGQRILFALVVDRKQIDLFAHGHYAGDHSRSSGLPGTLRLYREPDLIAIAADRDAHVWIFREFISQHGDLHLQRYFFASPLSSFTNSRNGTTSKLIKHLFERLEFPLARDVLVHFFEGLRKSLHELLFARGQWLL